MPYYEQEEWERLILKEIEKSKGNLNITEISKKLKASRITVSKYLTSLESKGKIRKKVVGRSKVYVLVI